MVDMGGPVTGVNLPRSPFNDPRFAESYAETRATI